MNVFSKTLTALGLAAALAATATSSPAAADPPAPDHVSIVSPASGSATNQTRVNVTVSFSTDSSGNGGGNVSAVELLLNGSVAATYQNPPQTKRGTHTFQAVDVSAFANTGTAVALVARAFRGNVDAGNSVDSAPVTLLVDTLAPTISVLMPASGSTTQSQKPKLSATVTDQGGSGINLSSVVAKLDGVVVAAVVTLQNPSSASVAFTPSSTLPDGPHAYSVDARDRAGNVAATATTNFTIESATDLAPPILSLSPSGGQRVQGPRPTLAAAYSDALSGVDLGSLRISLDGTDITSSFTVGQTQATLVPAAPLADGPHLLRAQVADKAGNLAQASALFRSESAIATLGQAGGSIAVSDPTLAAAGASLQIPAGALAQSSTFFVEAVSTHPPLAAGFAAVGPVVDFGPELTFLEPVTVTVPYSTSAVSALHGSAFAVRLLAFDQIQGVWVMVPLLSNDTARGLLTAQLSQLAGVELVGALSVSISPTETLIALSSPAVVADGVSLETLTVTPRDPQDVLVGPGLDVQATVTGIGTPAVSIKDLGNGLYQVYIQSTTTGTATIAISVGGTALPEQTVSFTPVPATFSIDGLPGSLVVGTAANLTISARDGAGNVLTSFAGAVEITLSGTRDALGNLVYPDSFVAVFTAADQGVLTLPSALVFASGRFAVGGPSITVLDLNVPTISGTAAVQLTAGPPAVMTKIFGDYQTGAPKTFLGPLAVQITDVFGNPIQGANVQFSVQSGGALLNR